MLTERCSPLGEMSQSDRGGFVGFADTTIPHSSFLTPHSSLTQNCKIVKGEIRIVYTE